MLIYGYSNGRFIAAILSRTIVEGFALGPMISLVSGSLPAPLKCHVWAPSHGVGIKIPTKMCLVIPVAFVPRLYQHILQVACYFTSQALYLEIYD